MAAYVTTNTRLPSTATLLIWNQTTNYVKYASFLYISVFNYLATSLSIIFKITI